jgi:predicted lysophospholipase L1 biosynthesis ABC-type transport system permease subunit
VILSEGEAKALWGNDNPIGGQVQIRGRARTVIGVVADSRSTSLKVAPLRMAYLHYKDQPPFATFFVARTVGPAEAVLSAMRQAIWQHAADVTIARVKTMDAQLADSLSPERFQTAVLSGFGLAALLLAMLGIYGVLSYSVASRKQEIGVRMALGASRVQVCRLTIAAVGTPVAIGLAAGLGASIITARAIQKLLYGVHIIDAAVIAAVIGLFVLASALAAFLPARRAASVDPMEVLRSE